jgi:dTDP-4-amino-4,6-dideoxygalactose transaminase
MASDAPEITFDPVTKPSRAMRHKGPVFGELEEDILYTFSGKSSIALALRFYRQERMLEDRTAQILVPSWLGTPVYNTMQKYCFPTTVFNGRVRGIMVYHQWGFPQRLDAIQELCDKESLFLVEDCAHALESYYRGKRLGTFGDAGIFSLSKFFPSVLGGALWTRKKALSDFVKLSFGQDDAVFAKKIFVDRVAYDRAPTKKNSLELERNYIVYDHLSRCPSYSRACAAHEVANGVVEKRRLLYGLYKEAFADEKRLASLVQERVVPWVVPLFLEEGKLKRVVAALRDIKVKSDVYHFDVNRNMLDPQFVPCIPLPCHQKMSEEDVSRIIATVKKVAA